MAVGESAIIFLALMFFTYAVVYQWNKFSGSVLFLTISMVSLLIDDDINKYMSTLFVLASLVSLAYALITPNIQKVTSYTGYTIGRK